MNTTMKRLISICLIFVFAIIASSTSNIAAYSQPNQDVVSSETTIENCPIFVEL